MQAIRFDRGQLQGRVTRTEEGYLRGDAIVTRTGVFPYRNDDGTLRYELRHPDDVYAADSIASMRMIPVTDGHPGDLVTADNADRLAIGHVGENVQIDGANVLASLSITHGEGVSAAEDGRVELSCGYRLDLIEEAGEYKGQHYDYRQTNIRYNHLALVDRARAGADARLNMDGAAVQETPTTKHREDGDIDMEKVNIDGIQYDAAPEVAKAYAKQQERIDALEGEVKEAKGKAETAEGRYDEAKAELDKVKETHNDEAIRKAARDRVGLETKARKALEQHGDEKSLDGLEDLSDREIKERVIKAKHDDIELKERGDEYVQARFDAVVDGLPEGDPDAIARQRQTAADKADGPVSLDKAREDAAKGVKEQWRGEKKSA